MFKILSSSRDILEGISELSATPLAMSLSLRQLRNRYISFSISALNDGITSESYTFTEVVIGFLLDTTLHFTMTRLARLSQKS